MSNDITLYNFEGSAVRVVTIDGEPWFVAKDVVERIGYTWNGAARIAHVPEEWRGVTSVVTPSGEQQMAVLSEAGVNFFLARSDKPAALPMQKWLAGEVLPTIRKTGGYGVQRDPIEVLNDPAAMRGLLLTYSEKVLALQAANDVLAPKADALDRISTAENSLSVTEAAKALQIRPKQLFNWLQEHSWIYKRAGGKHWLGYQSKTSAGLLEHKVATVLRADGSEKMVEQVRVTPKGLAKLSLQMSPTTQVAA